MGAAPIPHNQNNGTSTVTQQYSSPQAPDNTVAQQQVMNQSPELAAAVHPNQSAFLETLTQKMTEMERKSQKTLDLLMDRLERLEARDRGCNRLYH